MQQKFSKTRKHFFSGMENVAAAKKDATPPWSSWHFNMKKKATTT
jgi:hypothetical protein